MVRPSFDVEMWRCGISTAPYPEARDEIEMDLRARPLELVARTEVVSTSRSGRDVCAARRLPKLFEPTVVVPETMYLATDRGTVLGRMRARRSGHSNGFILPEDLVADRHG